jgi:hypothetical protein
MILTPRQSLVLRAVLSYAGSNVSDINEVFTEYDGSFVVNGENALPIEESEVFELWRLAGGN